MVCCGRTRVDNIVDIPGFSVRNKPEQHGCGLVGHDAAPLMPTSRWRLEYPRMPVAICGWRKSHARAITRVAVKLLERVLERFDVDRHLGAPADGNQRQTRTWRAGVVAFDP